MSYKKQIVGGITTFLTASYILAVVPSVLSTTGMDKLSAFYALIIVSVVGTCIMSKMSDYPILVAPSLGTLSYFAYVVSNKMGLGWHVALTIVFLSGLLFILLTVSRFREMLVMSIPSCIKHALTVGIGFFIGFIALKNVGMVIYDKYTLVTIGNLYSLKIGLFLLCFAFIVYLRAREITGAMLIGMISVMFIGYMLGIVQISGIASLPNFSLKGFADFDFHGVFNTSALTATLTFFIIALFDSTGTLISLDGMINKKTDYKRLNKALLAESITTTFSGLIGSSATGPFVESASGIKAGASNKIGGYTIAICFAFAIFFAPLFLSIPNFVTSAAMLYVAVIMFSDIRNIHWNNESECIPAALTIIFIPLTFSVVNGVAIGLISFIVIKISSKNYKDIPFFLYIVAIILIIFFLI